MHLPRVYTNNMKKTRSLLLITLLLVFAGAPAVASPLSDAYAAYHNGDYTTAVKDFQQATTQTTGPDQAKAYYGEGLAYRRMHDFGNAVQAFQQADRIDPTDSFASSKATYQRMLREAQHNYVGPMNGAASSRPFRGAVGAVSAPAVSAPVHASHAAAFLWGLLVVVAIVVILLIVWAEMQKRAQLAQMRGPVENLRQNVLANIEYIDGYADVLPKNNADSDQVRAFRQAAAAKFEQAEKVIGRATVVNDLVRAQALLDRANADTDQARRYLDRATGGTGKIPGDDAMRPAPLPTGQDQVQAVPEEQRGVSFFSSRPAPVSQLVPVTIMVNGQPRQVMATPDEAAEIQRGQMPPIRSFNVGGQSVPWYAYQNYDPYRDYWTYQNNGWRGILGGAVAGFLGAEVLGSLFNRGNYGGGWFSPYGFAPGWDSWGGWGGGGYGGGYDQGFLAGEQAERANDFAYNQPMGGYDTSDYGAGGGGYMGGDQS